MKLGSYFLVVLLFMVCDVYGQIGRLPLSPLQRVEQNIGITDIAIEYSRPSMRGRKIFGDLVPFDKLWRTGANRNTTIEFNQEVIINQKRIKKGKYAIFSKPYKAHWEIMLYDDTDNWNVPEDIDQTKIVARTLVETMPLNKAVEVFTIWIGDFTNYEFELNISWEKTTVSIPIELVTRELMDEKIFNVLDGPGYDDYYAAAEYQMESGKDYVLGLKWINTAIEMPNEVTWWDLRIKAILLKNLGKNKEAKTVAKEGLSMATAVKREYGIIEFKKLLSQLE